VPVGEVPDGRRLGPAGWNGPSRAGKAAEGGKPGVCPAPPKRPQPKEAGQSPAACSAGRPGVLSGEEKKCFESGKHRRKERNGSGAFQAGFLAPEGRAINLPVNRERVPVPAPSPAPDP